MSRQRILSVDTAYDPTLFSLFQNRKSYYRQIDEDPNFHVTQIYGFGVTKENFLEQCKLNHSSGEPFFRCLTISSHGSEDTVHNREFGLEVPLVSTADSDEVFRIIGKERLIYLLACKTAGGQMLKRLKDNGAKAVVGFYEEPTWGCFEGNKLWHDIDKALLSCFMVDNFKESVKNAVGQLVAHIANELKSSGVQYSKDLKKTRGVLESIVII